MMFWLLILLIITVLFLIFMFIIGFNLIIKFNYNNIDKIIKVFEENQKKDREIQMKYFKFLIKKTGDIFDKLDKFIINTEVISDCVMYEDITKDIINKVT